MARESGKKHDSLQAGGPESRPVDKPEGRPSALFHRQSVHLLLLGILGFLAYSNTFHSPFQWDEAEFILRNPVIKNMVYFMDPSRAETLFDNALISRYVGYMTFALNYRVHGFDVFGYHVVNLAIHIINAILVYFFVLLTFKTPYFTGPWARGYRLWEKDRQQAIGAAQIPLPLAPCPSPITYYLSPITSYSRFFALAVALLFVSHPVQTEAVTYVFQRFASLVSLFYLMSLVLYIKGRLASRHAGKLASYLLSLLCAVLAMKTKENAFTLPVVITLYESLFFSGPLKSRALRLAPFLLTLLIIPATLAGLSNTAAEVISQIKDPLALGFEKISRGDYLLTQFRVIVTYIRLLLLPAGQNIDYNYPLSHSFFEPRVLMSFVFLMSLFGTAVWLLYRSRQGKSRREARGHRQEKETEERPGAPPLNPPLPRGEVKGGVLPSPLAARRSPLAYSRLIAFGILWFFITLSVESSLIPIPMVINEYRVYLPSVGFFIALVAGVALLLNRSPRLTLHASRFAKITPALFALIILALASATYARNQLWKDKVNLWEDVVRKSPSSPRGYNNLGIAYHEKGLYQDAIKMYEQSLSISPRYRDAYVNLGITYAVTGYTGRAVENFLKGVEIDPENSTIFSNLARVYADTGRFDQAVENYLRAIELDSYDSSTYHGLGFAYVKLGKLDEALAAFAKFVELSPDNPEAYRNRGNVYGYKGDFVSAGADFRKACSLGSAEACNYLQDPRFH